MKEIKDRIIDELRGNIPDDIINKIEELIVQEKYRWAYDELQKIKEYKNWKPTETFMYLLEMFWWTYSN